MKTLINKISCTAIVIAVVLIASANPAKAQYYSYGSSKNLSNTLLLTSVACAVTAIVVGVVSYATKHSNKRHYADNFSPDNSYYAPETAVSLNNEFRQVKSGGNAALGDILLAKSSAPSLKSVSITTLSGTKLDKGFSQSDQVKLFSGTGR